MIKRAKKIENILPKNWLSAKHWEEISRGRHESHMWVKIAHVDPIPFGNQKFIYPKTIQESETHQTIILGSERLSGLGGATAGAQLKGARQTAEMAEEMGKALGNLELLRQAEKLRKEERALRKEAEKHEIIAPVSEKFDFYGFITITEFADEKIAKQNLENIRLMPTKGPLDISVPGANLPGMGDKPTVRELLKSDAMKSYMSEEQIKEAEKAMGEMQKEVKEKFPKNVKFKKGKYQGSDVVVVTGKGRPAASVVLKYSKDEGKVFHSARVGRFIVSGTLLRAVNTFPLGNSPCDSLTKFKTKTEVTKIGDKTFVDKEIRPVKSTLAKEGYLYKEEVDKIFRSIFSYIKK